MRVRYKKGEILTGIGASPGIAIGKAYRVDREKIKILRQYLIDASQVPTEIERFKEAVTNSEKQLLSIKKQIPNEIKGYSYIIDGQLMILKDNMIFDHTLSTIEREQINAEWALSKSLGKVREIFERIGDQYTQNRMGDIEYVTDLVLRNLAGKKFQGITDINEPVIVVAHNLTPADTAQMQLDKIMGFVTDAGGRTSHTAIVARSLKIPAVVGLESITEVLNNGCTVIVDGGAGLIILDPDEGMLTDYYGKQRQYRSYHDQILESGHLPAQTMDAVTIKIEANIEFVEEAASALDYGADGIGLYRTEFLYLDQKEYPSEELLFSSYRDVVETVHPKWATIRTLDLGSDKLPTHEATREANPAMGLRAIRFCLEYKEIFETQLRAILRASAYGNVRVIFPMISSLSELIEVKMIFHQVRERLESDGIPFDKKLKIGIMIEVPSAVILADALAKEVDFFSIGTNDLIQYTLAIDRVNKRVAHMYEPLHPAILRMLQHVIEAGHEAGIDVGMCGEMAAEPTYIPILLGLGLDELSMNAVSIPWIKKMIRATTIKESQQFLEEVLNFTRVDLIKEFVRDEIAKRFPDQLGLTGEF